MLGWLARLRIEISLRSDSKTLGCRCMMSSEMTLMATGSLLLTCAPRYTMAVAPRPNSVPSDWYSPTLNPRVCCMVAVASVGTRGAPSKQASKQMSGARAARVGPSLRRPRNARKHLGTR